MSKIYVGMIAQHEIMTRCVLSMIDAGLIDRLKVCQRNPPDNARNKIANDFLKTDCTHILWIDSDIVVPRDIEAKLLEVNEPVAGTLVYAPMNGMRSIPMLFDRMDTGIKPIPRRLVEQTLIECSKEGRLPLLPVYAIGSPLLMTREALEAVRDEDGMWFKQTWRDDAGKVRFGEDLYFFERCMKKQIRVVARLDCQVGHIKYGHFAHGWLQ